jgi:hypothetical protein
LTTYLPRSTVTVISPARSVRITRADASSRSRRVDWRGWPNLFPCPTLTIATSGRSTRSAATETASALPWCPTFSTSMSPREPSRTSGSSTSASASPVRSAENPSRSTRKTTLASLAAGSSTANRGHSADRTKLPACRVSPAPISCTLGAPTNAAASCRVRESRPVAPVGTQTIFAPTSPSSEVSPPEWSACRCVMTTASTDRTPARPSALLNADSLGPVSTNTALVPSRTMIASPWPTSSTSISAPAFTDGPTAIAQTPPARASAIMRARSLVGCGHPTQTAAPAATQTTTVAHLGKDNATAALGQDAIQAAASAQNAPAAPAASSTTSPSSCDGAETASPVRPRTSAAEMAGPATRLATGETSESVPNVPTIRGNVLAVATSVSAVGAASTPSHPGSAAEIHSSVIRAKSTIPATADTESSKPRSNALHGSNKRTPAAASASALAPSVRLPANHAAETASAITHARTADGWTPESTTYAPTTALTKTTRNQRGVPARVRSHPAIAATTTR